MTAAIIDGLKIGREIREEIRVGVAHLQQRGVTPGLAFILVGDNPSSISYVKSKNDACAEVGIDSQTFRGPADVSLSDLQALIREINANPRFHGLIVQLPLSIHLDEDAVMATIDPEKDVDGVHPASLGRLLRGQKTFLPATPAGVQQLLMRTGSDPAGKHVVVCGRSNIVGKPLATMLMQKAPGANATVTVCHTGTRDIASITRQADILVAAVGVPFFVTADMVREGAVVIDVGNNWVPDSSRKSGRRLVGDVDYEHVKDVAGAITPVPGGVGPMTVTMLLWNTLQSARDKTGF